MLPRHPAVRRIHIRVIGVYLSRQEASPPGSDRAARMGDTVMANERMVQMIAGRMQTAASIRAAIVHASHQHDHQTASALRMILQTMM
jgi:hypothetical protein